MNESITLVFPHQLYKNHPAISITREVILIEEWLYFKQFNFHKQKLILHRASMKFYQQQLKSEKINTHYIEAADDNCDVRKLISWLATQRVEEIHYVDTTDKWLQKRIEEAAKKNTIELVRYANPNFLNQIQDVDAFFNTRKTYFQKDFYNWQRKQRNILITAAGEPEGGKFSFDSENRKPVKKGDKIPTVSLPKENQFVKEAKIYVEKYFANNYGEMDNKASTNVGFYPTTFDETSTWLDVFFKERFANFGVFEDAIVAENHFLFHSALTPMLNVGLINPETVIKKALEVAPKYAIALNSLEGFIRQIMGWREFIRIVYEREGSRQRTKNYWGFTRKIPANFWTGTTGILPIDTVIAKLLKTGYSHHIERLMGMGNFMLLCEFDPDEVYRWFMEMYIDAYDWVMVPNTYGMTQFADGGLMTTKPYISGSNYLMKMSDYAKGDWQKVWDGLFWQSPFA